MSFKNVFVTFVREDVCYGAWVEAGGRLVELVLCGPENQTLLITCGSKHLYPNKSSHQASFSLFLFVLKSFKNISVYVFLFHIFANIFIWEARVRF